MTDTHLRHLEREAATSGQLTTPALLRERLRAGEECEEPDQEPIRALVRDGCLVVDPALYQILRSVLPGKKVVEQALIGRDDPIFDSIRHMVSGLNAPGLTVHESTMLPTTGGHSKLCPRCAGLSLLSRVELAAYCGNEAARDVLGGCSMYENCGHTSQERICGAATGCRSHFSTWLSGLERWDQLLMVRAACAAAEVASPVWERSLASDLSGPGRTRSLCPDDHGAVEFGGVPDGAADCPQCTDHRPRLAIQAARTWLECPCEEHCVECEAVSRSLNTGIGDDPMLRIACLVTSMASKQVKRVGHVGVDLLTLSGLALDLAGEPAVRAAIQTKLERWALT